MQQGPTDSRGWTRIAIAIGYVCLALVPLRLALMPYAETLNHFLYEDYFYYLEVARHVVEGNGVTFDGEAATNGFHPMWMVLCVVGYALSGPVTVIYGMLVVAALLHLGQAYLVFDILRRHANRWVGHAAAAFLILDYRAIACNLCGLETPLQGLFFLLVVRALLKHKGDLQLRDAIRWGVLLGLSAWARFDMGLLVAFTLIALTLDPRFGPSLASRLRNSTVAACATLATLLPWFVFSLNHSGSLLPNSRKAIALHATNVFDASLGLSANLEILRVRVFSASTWLGDTSNLLGLASSVPPSYSNFGGLSVGLILLGLGIYAWRTRRDEIGSSRFFLLAFATCHLAYYCLFVRAEARYLMPFSLTVLLLGCMWAGQWLRDNGQKVRVVLSACLALMLFNVVASGMSAWDKGWGATRTHMAHGSLHRSALWLEANTPEDAVIGAFNAGILGYFSGRQVVNLDGVINDEAILAMREQRMSDYMDQRGVDYLVDLEGQIESYMPRFSGRENWRSNFVEIARDESVIVLQRVSQP